MDRIDRQIIHCLQEDGRASFRLVSEVIGASEQTVSRRYRAMHDQGAMRVIALPTPAAAGQTSWFIRMQCRPGAADPIAKAISARDDVSWVSVTSGGGELICITRTNRHDATNSVLQRLPRTSQVLSFNAHSVLHSFVSGETEWMALGDPLSASQRRKLNGDIRKMSSGSRRDGATDGRLRDDDLPMLAALAADGRASITTISQQSGWPQARVSSRLQSLLAAHSVFVDIDFAPAMFGYHAIAYLWLTVAPSDLTATGNALARHPQTSFVAAITGSANLLAAVTCHDTDELYSYITNRVGALTAVHQAEVVPTLRRYKQGGTLVRANRLVVD